MNYESDGHRQAMDRLIGEMDCTGWSQGRTFNNSATGNSGVLRVANFLRGQSDPDLADKIGGKDIPPELETPERIGEFQVQQRLGAGGYGTVFLVRREADGQQFALKWLHATKSQSRIAFFREWVLTSELRHSSLVASYELGEFKDRPFYTMEYIQGQSLDRVIEEQRKAPSADYFFRMESLAIQIARGLEYLHRHQLIHRDIKPGNILIQDQDRAKLGDLGLVCDERTTASISKIGTLAFCAPEQIRGEKSSTSSDIFSFGSTLYEAFCLKRPFEGRDRDELSRAIQVCRPARPRSIDPRIPKSVEYVILKCLAKEPSQRYANAEELLKALLKVKSPAIRSVSRSFLKRWGFVTSALAMCVAANVWLPQFQEKIEVSAPLRINTKIADNGVSQSTQELQIISPSIKRPPLKEAVSEQPQGEVNSESVHSEASAQPNPPEMLATPTISSTQPTSNSERLATAGILQSLGVGTLNESVLNNLSLATTPYALVTLPWRAGENGQYLPELPNLNRVRQQTAKLHPKGIRVLADLDFTQSEAYRVIAERLFEVSDGVFVTDAFSNGEQVRASLNRYRDLAKRDVHVVFACTTDYRKFRGEKDLRFFAGMAMLIRDPGDPISVLDSFRGLARPRVGEAEWSNWPTQLGTPINKTFSMDRNSLSRKFKNGALTVDLDSKTVQITLNSPTSFSLASR